MTAMSIALRCAGTAGANERAELARYQATRATTASRIDAAYLTSNASRSPRSSESDTNSSSRLSMHRSMSCSTRKPS